MSQPTNKRKKCRFRKVERMNTSTELLLSFNGNASAPARVTSATVSAETWYEAVPGEMFFFCSFSWVGVGLCLLKVICFYFFQFVNHQCGGGHFCFFPKCETAWPTHGFLTNLFWGKWISWTHPQTVDVSEFPIVFRVGFLLPIE